MGGAPPALRLQIHVQPRAARTRIVGRHGETLKVQVHAPPVGGAANAALVELLADTLHLPRRAIRILRGTTGREKLVEVDCPDHAACLRQLQACFQPAGLGSPERPNGERIAARTQAAGPRVDKEKGPG